MCLNDQKFSHLHSLVVIVIISSKKREEIIELTAQEDGGRVQMMLGANLDACLHVSGSSRERLCVLYTV